MKLNDYLSLRKISQAEFGQKLNPPASQGLVSQWITGETRVTLGRALEIKEVTDGDVTERDCHEMFKSPAEHPAPLKAA